MGLADFTKGIIDDALHNAEEKMELKKEQELLAKQRKEEFEQKQSEYSKLFQATKKIGNLEVDEIHELFRIPSAEANIKKTSAMKSIGKGVLALYTLGASLAIEYALKPNATIFSFEELIDFDLLENNNSIASGGLGRAIAGGLVLGGVGAVVGGVTGRRKIKGTCEMLVLQISTNNMFFPNLMITYINKEVKKKDKKYINALNDARTTISGLNIIIQQNEQKKVTKVSIEADNSKSKEDANNPYEELKQLKELLDMGIISQEEFETKKKELLNL